MQNVTTLWRGIPHYLKKLINRTQFITCGFLFLYKRCYQTSGQDGGTGRYTVPPRITKRRATTNSKTKHNQNWQKIELYGSPTTKELKKKHSSRLVGAAETDSSYHWRGSESRQWLEEQGGQGGGTWQGRLWTGRSHILVQINWEEQLGSDTDLASQSSSARK